MREAIGGAYLFYFIIGFLVIYIFFMGFVMNYASTYRAANYIVTQIEVCQGEAKCSTQDFTDLTLKNLTKAVKSKYHYAGSKSESVSICCVNNGNGAVFRVKMPVDFNVPLLGDITVITVKAETKTILNKSCDNSKLSKDIKNSC